MTQFNSIWFLPRQYSGMLLPQHVNHVRQHTNSLDHGEGLHLNSMNVSLQQFCIMGMNVAGEDPGKHTERALRL